MGYISLKKANGQVDLLPAENIIHVGNASTSQIAVDYSHNATSSTRIRAYIQFTATNDQLADIRKKVNAAIELANGASGPAVSVDLPVLVTAVQIEAMGYQA